MAAERAALFRSGEGTPLGLLGQLRFAANRNRSPRATAGFGPNPRPPGRGLRPGEISLQGHEPLASLERRDVHGTSRTPLSSPAFAVGLPVVRSRNRSQNRKTKRASPSAAIPATANVRAKFPMTTERAAGSAAACQCYPLIYGFAGAPVAGLGGAAGLAAGAAPPFTG